jgi:hypothetical protein
MCLLSSFNFLSHAFFFEGENNKTSLLKKIKKQNLHFVIYTGFKETCRPGVFSFSISLCTRRRYKVGLHRTWRSWYKNF